MKHVKRLFSVALALVLTLAMAVPAMASSVSGRNENTTVNVTVPGPEDDKDGLLTEHQFTAYQVFSGTQGVKDDVLGDVEWGNGINGDDFLAELSTDARLEGAFAGKTTAQEVSEVLETLADDAGKLEIIAQIAYKHINKENGIKLNTGNNAILPGYYLIVDTTPDATVGSDGVYNAALLQATRDVDIQVKTDKPSIKKKIDGGKDDDPNSTGMVDYDQVPIGKVVAYQLESVVPDMTHYVDYKFVISDMMSKGLTFQDDVAVYIGELNDAHKLTADVDYEVKKGDSTGILSGEYADGTYIQIVFKNFYEKNIDKKGETIYVTYTAKVNEDAVIGEVGNPNQVRLQYSNKPNEVGSGDEFGPDEPKGETPWDQVRTFETAVELFKKDGGDGQPLTGAVFEVTGEMLKDILISKTEFKEDAAGTYWLLKDGTYTTTDPTTEGIDKSKYASETQKYKRETTYSKEETATDVKLTLPVDKDGKLVLKGLGAGTYIFKEIKAPEGYNLLKGTLEVTITNTYSDTDDSKNGAGNTTWTAKLTRKDEEGNPQGSDETLEVTTDNDTFVFSFDVNNNQGAELPETGGIGTTIFYVIGAILVLGAGVLLITRKRMSKEQ